MEGKYIMVTLATNSKHSFWIKIRIIFAFFISLGAIMVALCFTINGLKKHQENITTIMMSSDYLSAAVDYLQKTSEYYNGETNEEFLSKIDKELINSNQNTRSFFRALIERDSTIVSSLVDKFELNSKIYHIDEQFYQFFDHIMYLVYNEDPLIYELKFHRLHKELIIVAEDKTSLEVEKDNKNYHSIIKMLNRRRKRLFLNILLEIYHYSSIDIDSIILDEISNMNDVKEDIPLYSIYSGLIRHDKNKNNEFTQMLFESTRKDPTLTNQLVNLNLRIYNRIDSLTTKFKIDESEDEYYKKYIDSARDYLYYLGITYNDRIANIDETICNVQCRNSYQYKLTDWLTFSIYITMGIVICIFCILSLRYHKQYNLDDELTKTICTDNQELSELMLSKLDPLSLSKKNNGIKMYLLNVLKLKNDNIYIPKVLHEEYLNEYYLQEEYEKEKIRNTFVWLIRLGIIGTLLGIYLAFSEMQNGMSAETEGVHFLDTLVKAVGGNAVAVITSLVAHFVTFFFEASVCFKLFELSSTAMIREIYKQLMDKSTLEDPFSDAREDLNRIVIEFKFWFEMIKKSKLEEKIVETTNTITICNNCLKLFYSKLRITIEESDYMHYYINSLIQVLESVRNDLRNIDMISISEILDTSLELNDAFESELFLVETIKESKNIIIDSISSLSKFNQTLKDFDSSQIDKISLVMTDISKAIINLKISLGVKNDNKD